MRVIRGAHKGSSYAPVRGYRYDDGIHFVEGYGSAIGQDGFLVWRFRLVKEAGERDPETVSPQTQASTAHAPAPRVAVTTQRIVRSTSISQRIKDFYANQCQVCGESLSVVSGTYSEAAHIQGLGTPHNGPDIEDNILCLCPSHHVRLDNGGIYIRDDFVVMDAMQKKPLGALKVHPGHVIDVQHIRSHRTRWRYQ